MPESLLDRRLRLGRFLGIDLFVHWTFGLVILYVAMMASDTGADGMAFAVGQLLGVFLCVTLHEYGHAMAARQFGIATADITLLPIGGVARLKQMPRVPWQELIVAVAGPAVNVVIVAALLVGFLTLTDMSVLSASLRYFVALLAGLPVDDGTVDTVTAALAAPSTIGFAIAMLVVNIMLVVFNMIPAFPMDGGRVFRSVMAMGIDYRRATRIASRVGLGCAALLAFVALSADPPRWVPVLIAVFVGYAGMAEARQVEVMEAVRGLTVGDVMIRTNESLPMDMPLPQIALRWQSTQATSLPVVSLVGTVVGMVQLQDLQAAIRSNMDPNTTAGQLVNHEIPQVNVRVSDDLDAALAAAGRQRRQIPVVNQLNQLCGVIDLDTMLSRGQLNRRFAVSDWNARSHFDQLS